MACRLCALGIRAPYFKSCISACYRLNACQAYATGSKDTSPNFIPPGLQKQLKLRPEDLPDLNPGPPVTMDDDQIPFRPIEEVKKELSGTFNAYFWGSFIVFCISCYIAFVVEDIVPYDSYAPVKSYRDRHKGKKPDAGKVEKETLPTTDGAVASVASEVLESSGGAIEGMSQAQRQAQSALEDSGDSSPRNAQPETPPTPSLQEPVTVLAMQKEEEEEDSIDVLSSLDPNKLPEEVPYLLIGSGTASYYAALAIRARDEDAKVLMIGEENHLPYSRPPLSKELWWTGDVNVANTLEYKGYSGKKRDVFFEVPGFYVKPGHLSHMKHGGVALVSGHRVVKLDPSAHTAYLEDGREIKYKKCLIATGGRPRSLPIIESAGDDVKQKVMLYRTIDDFRKLEDIAKNSESITIVGGSFLGSELANALEKRYGEKGLRVNQVFREKGNVAEIMPEFLSKYTTKELRESGVNVMAEKEIRRLSISENGKLRIQLAGGEVFETDQLVVAVGIDANTDLAKASGLEIDPVNGGYIVDAELRARTDIWVAGDASSFYDVKLGRRRVEHWEHAQITGRLAGENMTGGERPYWHQSSYYSTIAPNVHFEAVGRTDSNLRTVSVLAANVNKADELTHGVVFYLDGKVIVGVLLLNVFGPGIEIARKLIADGREHDDLKQVAKLFDLHASRRDTNGIE